MFHAGLGFVFSRMLATSYFGRGEAEEAGGASAVGAWPGAMDPIRQNTMQVTPYACANRICFSPDRSNSDRQTRTNHFALDFRVEIGRISDFPSSQLSGILCGTHLISRARMH